MLTHVQYESPITSCLNVMVKVKFLVRHGESPENYCHSPGVVDGVIVHRQKL